MQPKPSSIWHQIGEYARYTPTPHNTQPIKLKVLSDTKAELYYDLTRGLPKGDPPARYALTAVGLFTETCKIAAAGLGYELNWVYLNQPLQTTEMDGVQKVADFNLKKHTGSHTNELPAELILKRHTNRLAYNDTKLSREVVTELKTEAKKYHHEFHIQDDKAVVDWVTALNRRMVFYDLEDKPVRDELAGWTRFNNRQAQKTHDGLSAHALHVPGWGLALYLKHYGFMKIPGLKRLLKWLYWQNMQGIPTVSWIQGPFFTTKDYLQSGHVLMRIWLIMAKHGVAYHPFGSVLTSQKAHDEFREYLHIDESKSMVWMLMRVGYTDQEPPHAERLPLDDYFI